MFQSLASTSGGNSGGGPGGGASEALVAGLVRECLLALPPAFDLEAVQRKYPVLYEESMNTVLVQEMTRFNKLTGVIRESLQSIHLALQVTTPAASTPHPLPHYHMVPCQCAILDHQPLLLVVCLTALCVSVAALACFHMTLYTDVEV